MVWDQESKIAIFSSGECRYPSYKICKEKLKMGTGDSLPFFNKKRL
jgi:hypothetical protein